MKSVEMSNLSRRNMNKSQADDAWICVDCEKEFGDPMDQVMECDNCSKHLCAKCLKMPSAVYEFMCKSKGTWCCDTCTPEVKSLIKGATAPKMNPDVDKTVDSVKSLMEHFYYFMNGTKTKSQPTMGSSTVKDNAWKVEPQVTKPLKGIILEAGAEQKREEEDLGRKKNLIIHKAPENQPRDSKKLYNENMSLIQQLCSTIEIEPTKIKNCTRLGKTPEQENSASPAH